MTAPEPGPLSDEAAEADVLEQRAATTPADDVDDGSPRASTTSGAYRDDVTTLEANPVDVAEQQLAVPMDSDDRDDYP